ncbi:hypothetical protein [Streptomyces sp. NPDC006879]|uniref:hypothetical protein n=1 Tax=Streptomyces sp. NPDC006879 TaxID=3364767 RepID=UPI00369228B6
MRIKYSRSGIDKPSEPLKSKVATQMLYALAHGHYEHTTYTSTLDRWEVSSEPFTLEPCDWKVAHYSHAATVACSACEADVTIGRHSPAWRMKEQRSILVEYRALRRWSWIPILIPLIIGYALWKTLPAGSLLAPFLFISLIFCKGALVDLLTGPEDADEYEFSPKNSYGNIRHRLIPHTPQTRKGETRPASFWATS